MGKRGEIGGRRPHHRTPEASLGFLLWRATRTFLEDLRDELAVRGYDNLSPTQVNVMPMLDADGTSAQVLAARIGVSKQAAAKIVGELERLGYVRRESDPNDARARLVRVTAKGHALLDEGERAKSAIEARWLAGLDPADVSTLKRTLAAIVKSAVR